MLRQLRLLRDGDWRRFPWLPRLDHSHFSAFDSLAGVRDELGEVPISTFPRAILLPARSVVGAGERFT